MKLKGLVIKTDGPNEMEDVANAIGNAAIIMYHMIDAKCDIGDDVIELKRQCDLVRKFEDMLFKLADRTNELNKYNGEAKVILQFLMENEDKAFTENNLMGLSKISPQYMRFILMSLIHHKAIISRKITVDAESQTYYRYNMRW